jgi:thymidylate synthase ThyX
MPIEAKLIEDSIAPNGVRLTTFQLRYPRFIHAEFMTHRVFSRNASSSRAIPVEKMIQQVREAPAEPVHWGLNQPGMQAHSELDSEMKSLARSAWREAAEAAAVSAENLNKLGLHKQVVNRVLEPFSHISVIVTATEWVNFFELRAHPDAQPEIQTLAFQMKSIFEESAPRQAGDDARRADGWHLPYITASERAEKGGPEALAKISAARCARVSYLTHDGAHPSREKDLQLYDRLVGSRPLHASPVEHQAYALDSSSSWCKNFRGWRQFRADVEASI